MPPVRRVNMRVETAPTSETGAILTSRPGLEQAATAGAGPVAGLATSDGSFEGDLFAVSGAKLYRETTLLGDVPGDLPPSMAQSATQLAVTLGRKLYRYSEADGLDPVAFPDNADVRKVLYHDSLFLALRRDTEEWYFSDALDLDSWQALSFASAERDPDFLIDAVTINDTLLLFGSESIEPWANTGDADLPYSRIEQRLFDKGIKATGCVRVADNTALWVGTDNFVYRLSDNPVRISTPAVEEKIEASASVTTYTYKHDGHDMFAVRLDTSTWEYDLTQGEWGENATYGRPNFRPLCAVMRNGQPLFGDDAEGMIWAYGDGWMDGTAPMERRFTGFFSLPGGALVVDNLSIEANVGRTGNLSGQGSNPVVELRSSRSAGATWGPWVAQSLGAQGQYRRRIAWRRCGMFDAPGGIFEFRCTDPVPFRISAVRVNEAWGGRSR